MFEKSFCFQLCFVGLNQAICDAGLTELLSGDGGSPRLFGNAFFGPFSYLRHSLFVSWGNGQSPASLAVQNQLKNLVICTGFIFCHDFIVLHRILLAFLFKGDIICEH